MSQILFHKLHLFIGKTFRGATVLRYRKPLITQLMSKCGLPDLLGEAESEAQRVKIFQAISFSNISDKKQFFVLLKFQV